MLKQHQVGVLFGLFVHAIGAARFTWSILPLIVLLGLATLPFPRAASTLSTLDSSTPSSGFAQVLTVAQRPAVPFPYRVSSADESSRRPSAQDAGRAVAPVRTVRAVSERAASAAPSSFSQRHELTVRRIGDRWLHARAEHSSMRNSEISPRSIGERLLRSHDATIGIHGWPTVELTEAIVALRNDALAGVAQLRNAGTAPVRVFGARSEERALALPPRRDTVVRDGLAGPRDGLAGPFMPRADVGTLEAQDNARRATQPVSPLKLSPEQHNIANFVARRYRVGIDDVQRFVAHAYRAAKDFRLDPYLVLAVMSIESSFNPNARSSAGAQGLMQVLTRVHLEKFAPFGGPRAALDPMVSINVGSRILKEYLVREGSVEGALKSYVGAAMLSHDFGYGDKVLGERARIAAVAEGRPIPAAPVRRVFRASPTVALADTGSSKTASVVAREAAAKPVAEASDRVERTSADGAATKANGVAVSTEASGEIAGRAAERETSEAAAHVSSSTQVPAGVGAPSPAAAPVLPDPATPAPAGSAPAEASLDSDGSDSLGAYPGDPLAQTLRDLRSL